MSKDAILIASAIVLQTVIWLYWQRRWFKENLEEQDKWMKARDERYAKDVAFGVSEFISHVVKAIAKERKDASQ